MEFQKKSLEEEEIDILQIIRYLLRYWYLFAISVIIFIVIGYFYTKSLTPLYQVSSSVIIKQEQSAPEEMLLLKDFGLNSGTNNIDNEIGTIKSIDLLTRVVSSLEHYTTYRKESKFYFYYSPDLYKTSPYYVRWENMEPDKIPFTVVHEIEDTGTEFLVTCKYNVNGEDFTHTITIKTLPAIIDFKIGKFYLEKTDYYSKNEELVTATIQNPYSIAQSILKNLTVNTSTKQSSQLNISLKSENKLKGTDYLTTLINEYNKDAIKDKNLISFNTSVFIEERLKEIASELGEVEGKVETFRRENKVADIPTQVKGYLEQTDEFNTQRVELETQLNLLGYIGDFISDPKNKSKLIPNLGIKDPGLNSIIKGYNELLIEKNRIENSSSESNPVLIQMNTKAENLLSNILASLGNEINASTIALRNLQRENTTNNNIINKLPTVDREYTDILRQQAVKSNLFVFLLQKREETNLTQAAVAPKAKIIEQPRGSSGPVEPNKSMLILMFFMVGIILPAGLLFIRNLLHTKIEGVQDLSHLKDVAVIGDIAIIKEFPNPHTRLIVEANNTSPVNEMFRTLRGNLLFMTSEESQKVIIVTSTVPKEGKTFVAANVAKSLSLLEKRSILVGADIRNPQISNTLGIEKSKIGLTSYLAGITEDPNEIIQQIDDNFFTIQTGPIPPNPSELLTKAKFGELIEELKKRFDFIIIDSAPVGPVSDTFGISKYADATLYVIRENFSQKDTISFINGVQHEKRLQNIAVVLNQTNSLGKRGNYKYNYKYGYNYSYRYKYGYKA